MKVFKTATGAWAVEALRRYRVQQLDLDGWTVEQDEFETLADAVEAARAFEPGPLAFKVAIERVDRVFPTRTKAVQVARDLELADVIDHDCEFDDVEFTS